MAAPDNESRSYGTAMLFHARRRRHTHPGDSIAVTLFSTHPETRKRIKVFQAQEVVTQGC